MSDEVISGAAVVLYTGGARVIYRGDGAVVNFPVPFEVESSLESGAAIRVFSAANSDFADLQEVPGSAWSYISGGVTLANAPGSDTRLVIMRATPIARRGNYTAGGMLTARSLNGDLDRLTMIAEDLREKYQIALDGGGAEYSSKAGVINITEVLHRQVSGAVASATAAVSGYAAIAGGYADEAGRFADTASTYAANASVAAAEVFSSGGLISGGLVVSTTSGVRAVVSGAEVGVSGPQNAILSAGSDVALLAAHAVNASGLDVNANAANALNATAGGNVNVNALNIYTSATSDTAISAAHAVNLFGGSDVNANAGRHVNISATVGNINASASGAIFLSGGMGVAVSGGLTVNGEAAATQPWVLTQIASSAGAWDGGVVHSATSFLSGATVSEGLVVNGGLTATGGIDVGSGIISGEPRLSMIGDGITLSAVADVELDAGYLLLYGHDIELEADRNLTLLAASGARIVGGLAVRTSGAVISANTGDAEWYAKDYTSPDAENNAYPEVAKYVVKSGTEVGFRAGQYNGARLFYDTLDEEEYVALTVGRSGIYLSYESNGAASPNAVLSLKRGGVVIGYDADGDDEKTATLCVSGGRFYYEGVSSGVSRAGNVLLDTDPLPVPSGAIVSGAEFKTSVGGYLLTYTGSGGLMVSGGGVALQVSSGAVSAGVDDGDHQARVTITSGGIVLDTSDPTNIANVTVIPGEVNITGNTGVGGVGVIVNDRPVLTELVTSTDTTTTSANIAELAGGMMYVYTQPLTSLSVASIASSMQEAWIKFTVASGGSVSIDDSGFEWWGGRPSVYEGGSSYAVGAWGGMLVCNKLEV